jgi:hypothetical protein
MNGLSASPAPGAAPSDAALPKTRGNREHGLPTHFYYTTFHALLTITIPYIQTISQITLPTFSYVP